MKVYKSISEIPEFKQSVMTIGSFDGLHIGHQKIIEKVKAKAKENDLESIVVTFCPHPRLVLSPNDDDFKLLSIDEEKIALFEKVGIDHLVMFPFSFEFSQLSPEEYIEKFIVKFFNPSIIIIGYDHRFGKNRTGDIYYLKKNAEQYGYKVIEISKQVIEDIGISSTLIRKALTEGDIQLANHYAGHHYTLQGKVIYGYKYGRKLGFPTANLDVTNKKLIPADGVYAVRVYLDNTAYAGMMYIGRKPTLNHDGSRVIEVHIFDFTYDIYGEKVKIELIDQIRGSQKFKSPDDLKAQLEKDQQLALKAIQQSSSMVIPKKDVAIVILNYNGKDYLEEYLPSVVQEDKYAIQYIMADNGSTDDSIKFVESYYPEFTIHELDNNYGFAEGYNRVIRAIEDTEYVVFLNSDVETEAGWLDPILDLMKKDKKIAIAQPRIRSYDEKEKFEYAGAAGGYIDALGYPFCRGRIFDSIEVDEDQYNDSKEVFWASGAAMVMRRDLFLKFGGFDTDFFAHQEEIDLCWRLKKAGYKVVATGESKIYHLGGGTLSYVNPHKNYLNFRNNLVMMLKNEAGLDILWKFPTRLILDGIAAIKFAFEGNPKSLVAILRAHLYIYRHLGSIYRKRQGIKTLVNKEAIGSERIAGRYRGIIIWDYFIKKRKKFTDLNTDA